MPLGSLGSAGTLADTVVSLFPCLAGRGTMGSGCDPIATRESPGRYRLRHPTPPLCRLCAVPPARAVVSGLVGHLPSAWPC